MASALQILHWEKMRRVGVAYRTGKRTGLGRALGDFPVLDGSLSTPVKDRAVQNMRNGEGT